ncbi:ACT domain-containing protein [Ornithinibacillus gellani]|uniref:ACT domain-containing protein n=1 Tax=Ornithinibacillus gellani TaxID=2293253 RepID=UPI000F466B85|nr:ACT domain-containing protein [Ornithinibacillus gellani]TQS74675.1 ACT domain-containing protein [Ornithinibacillus gellani]
MVVENGKFYLVRSDVLPESMQKTIEVKELLERGKAKSIYEAVQLAGLSRSAFYKYKDAVYPFQAMVKEKIITLFFHLEDRAGTLSKLLGIVAAAGCNVLTIHQTIPIQGKANVTLSLDVSHLKEDMDRLMQQLKRLDFIERVDMLSSGA